MNKSETVRSILRNLILILNWRPTNTNYPIRVRHSKIVQTLKIRNPRDQIWDFNRYDFSELKQELWLILLLIPWQCCCPLSWRGGSRHTCRSRDVPVRPSHCGTPCTHTNSNPSVLYVHFIFYTEKDKVLRRFMYNVYNAIFPFFIFPHSYKFHSPSPWQWIVVWNISYDLEKAWSGYPA